MVSESRAGIVSPGERTPGVSLKEVFMRAAGELPEQDDRARVVGDALDHLQRGFDSHYASGDESIAADDAILLGDDAYARAVETIAWLDEPRFVAVASRMIRDGAGEITAGRGVSLQVWTPHLAGLLGIISGEDQEMSEARIRDAAREQNL